MISTVCESLPLASVTTQRAVVCLNRYSVRARDKTDLHRMSVKILQGAVQKK